MDIRHYLFLSIVACACAAGQVAVAGPHDPLPAPVMSNTNGVAVRFDLYDGYLIVAHGSAGPLHDLNFLLDTGTSLPILDSRIARKLHLQGEGPARIVILGGRAQAQEAILPSLTLGPVRRSNLQIVTADLSFFGRILPVRLDAIVGLDVIGQSAFVIDYSARVIRFGQQPALPVSIPLRLDGGLASFDAEIDHAPVHLVLDTGAASVVLFDKTPAEPESGRNAGSLQKPDTIGAFARKTVRLRTMRLGDEEFRQKAAILVRNPKQSQLDFDGMMSPVALGISQVFVDLRDGVVAFSR
jgi:predicted aspartyl protease